MMKRMLMMVLALGFIVLGFYAWNLRQTNQKKVREMPPETIVTPGKQILDEQYSESL